MNSNKYFRALTVGAHTSRKTAISTTSSAEAAQKSRPVSTGAKKRTHQQKSLDETLTDRAKREAESDSEDDQDDTTPSGNGMDASSSEEEEPGLRVYSGADVHEKGAPHRKRRNKLLRKSGARVEQIRQEEINRKRKQNNIHVLGADVCEPIASFAELKLRYNITDQLLENIANVGYAVPTPVQMQAVPILLERREVLASAPTGSGKTAAFAIPILHALGKHKTVGYRAVVVSPTRELAKQTFFEFQRLGAGMGYHIQFISNTIKLEKLLRKKPSIAKKMDILITTPNKLVHLLQDTEGKSPVISLENVEWLVIDESDKLFEAEKEGGFRDQLGVIYKACSSPRICRTLFSATFAVEVEEWCKLNLNNVIMLSIGARNAATEAVEQKLLFVGSTGAKVTALRQLLKENFTPPILIFVQTKQAAKELYREIGHEGFHADVIHSDRDQQERDRVVDSFRSGKLWTLIATDVLGRGVDFKGVNLVINYDFPRTSISYIHRIGRAGRAGTKGKAITLYTEKDYVLLRSVAKVIKRSGGEIPDFMLQLPKATKSEKERLQFRWNRRKTHTGKRKRPQKMPTKSS
ncbi:probable ATP-dependent RNA helicase DDX52 [Paramacrobiotus metropolitanus]|uniref:probable ATP-dependent RNA helicase DDX52 n=1 Tax=Paramacrobiotus metropolitanus TaxID=2943436 RepID=UPI002445E582|nr:probable ATP-dependent RNA helicase DDX52 [Paramacrobiotus metropolitanus]